MFAFEDFGCSSHIIHSSVCTGTDHYLINPDIPGNFINGLRILRQVRKSNRRSKSTSVNGILFIIYRILVRFLVVIFSVGMLLHISNGQIIYRENTVLATGFNCHVRNGKAGIHCKVLNAVPGKFHGLI